MKSKQKSLNRDAHERIQQNNDFSKKIAWKQQEKEKGREIKMNLDFSTKLY